VDEFMEMVEQGTTVSIFGTSGAPFVSLKSIEFGIASLTYPSVSRHHQSVL